ncbi:MAG: hypothetical protein CSA62_07415 [Planctomycetota bacterium]|nr:MAG: hypothetical protein CSA62_07415 [Planctomycetota bacterium]
MAPYQELHTKAGPADTPLFECMLVGLGNPGEEYRDSRHNVGFDVVDALAESLDLRFARVRKFDPFLGAGFSGKVKAQLAQGRLPMLLPPNPVLGAEAAGKGETGDDVPKLRLRSFLLVKPWTYMNMSGVAVAALARYCRIPPASIFVVYDDLNLPLGRMRIRSEGSPGGHNGMKSLVSCLGTEGFPRLRMGIGAEGLPNSAMVDPDFVLGRFEDDERPLLQRIHAASVDACRSWLSGTALDVLMNRYNPIRVSSEDLSSEGSGCEGSEETGESQPS